MKNRNRIILIALLGVSSITFFSSCKQNWPQFRGPEANMLTSVKNLPEEWGDENNIKWTFDLGGSAGWSSPIIWGNRIFITAAYPVKTNPVPERGPVPGPPPGAQAPQPGQGQQGRQMPPQGQAGQNPPQGPPQPQVRDTSYLQEIYRWELACIDINTGKEIWKQIAYEGAPKTGKNQGSTYACETPVTDGKRVYAYFGMHGLFCYDIDGTLLWKKDLGVYWTQNGWGTGSSPLVYDGILYILNDNEENSILIALDAVTGEEKWKVQRDDKTSYSTPYIWKNKLRTELIISAKTARSYNPQTGVLLWEMKIGGEHSIPSPVGNEEFLYLGNAGMQIKGYLYAVKPGAEGDITPEEGQLSSEWIAWTYTETNLGNSSSLLYNGKLYNIASRGGQVLCLDAHSGEVIYTGRIPGFGAVWASPWGYNGKVWFYDENGTTVSLSGGDTFEYTADNKLDDKFWASVAITNNTYIFKGVEKIYCVRE